MSYINIIIVNSCREGEKNDFVKIQCRINSITRIITIFREVYVRMCWRGDRSVNSTACGYVAHAARSIGRGAGYVRQQPRLGRQWEQNQPADGPRGRRDAHASACVPESSCTADWLTVGMNGARDLAAPLRSALEPPTTAAPGYTTSHDITVRWRTIITVPIEHSRGEHGAHTHTYRNTLAWRRRAVVVIILTHNTRRRYIRRCTAQLTRKRADARSSGIARASFYFKWNCFFFSYLLPIVVSEAFPAGPQPPIVRDQKKNAVAVVDNKKRIRCHRRDDTWPYCFLLNDGGGRRRRRRHMPLRRRRLFLCTTHYYYYTNRDHHTTLYATRRRSVVCVFCKLKAARIEEDGGVSGGVVVGSWYGRAGVHPFRIRHTHTHAHLQTSSSCPDFCCCTPPHCCCCYCSRSSFPYHRWVSRDTRLWSIIRANGEFHNKTGSGSSINNGLLLRRIIIIIIRSASLTRFDGDEK